MAFHVGDFPRSNNNAHACIFYHNTIIFKTTKIVEINREYNENQKYRVQNWRKSLELSKSCSCIFRVFKKGCTQNEILVVKGCDLIFFKTFEKKNVISQKSLNLQLIYLSIRVILLREIISETLYLYSVLCECCVHVMWQIFKYHMKKFSRENCTRQHPSSKIGGKWEI